ncbi:MAG: hypothetical protein LH475_05455 [Cryobacterium sp.]|uniref:hypothetical protein n=1 Tax=unclassified Cryobacterium TaxID=2649013 RepID=UPI0018C9D5CA|nr:MULTISPECIES: hypothetical protein [unclassified Cryobacterium]MCY7404062.1 hypothetical protein [Cryobacterium sp.]MEC5154313.1 hypothetical protein [Cryobacterium sp. CAN_C3]
MFPAHRADVPPTDAEHRSAAAQQKASTHDTSAGEAAYSFTGLLNHLATQTRNDLRYGADETTPTIPTLALPTPIQRRAFELIGATIPLTLK